MHFDIIVGNPPYQEMTGGGGAVERSKPIYPDFIQLAVDLNPKYISMIIPARWYNDDSPKSTNLRHRLFRHTKILVDFPDSKVCFPDVLISGGLCYFLWDVNHLGLSEITLVSDYNKETYTQDLREGNPYVRYKILDQVAKKVQSKADIFISDICLESNPFGYETYRRGEDDNAAGDIILISSHGSGYVSYKSVTKNEELVYKYKVITGYKTPGSDATTTKSCRKVINKPQVLIPGVVCTQTYFVTGTFDSPEEADNFREYLETKFARALILVALVGTTLTKRTYRYVPFLDFSHKWTPDELYSLFDLTGVEIFFIEELIRSMN